LECLDHERGEAPGRRDPGEQTTHFQELVLEQIVPRLDDRVLELHDVDD